PFESRIQNLQYRDLFYTKIPRALRFNDRVSMLHSTELREPFLDYRLVEIAFARRDDEKIRNGQQKWMLRQIAAEKLGNSIALAPKRPVQTPQREWLRNELKDWAQHHIDLFSNYDFVDKAKVKKYWNEFLNSDAVDNSFFVWQWINTALILQ
ncbi:MAG TPA: asparagine synthase-related protein, partial [Phnomibacter sp.]|nr:asparagine synthase-related protein [Phnomibacter sp.]